MKLILALKGDLQTIFFFYLKVTNKVEESVIIRRRNYNVFKIHNKLH